MSSSSVLSSLSLLLLSPSIDFNIDIDLQEDERGKRHVGMKAHICGVGRYMTTEHRRIVDFFIVCFVHAIY